MNGCGYCSTGTGGVRAFERLAIRSTGLSEVCVFDEAALGGLAGLRDEGIGARDCVACFGLLRETVFGPP